MSNLLIACIVLHVQLVNKEHQMERWTIFNNLQVWLRYWIKMNEHIEITLNIECLVKSLNQLEELYFHDSFKSKLHICIAHLARITSEPIYWLTDNRFSRLEAKRLAVTKDYFSSLKAWKSRLGLPKYIEHVEVLFQ